ncbi:MAG: ABC transporter ATP-binding protein [Chloroflexi bacterium]|nr:ABC transporter ATP-binding protein [Chloroflexota bacterium]
MVIPNNHDSQSDSTQLAIDVRGLGKSYGRTPVLRNLRLQVPWGQTLTVLGPNGSGKTTLIKTLAMLAKPDAGEVRIAGLSTRRNGVRVRRVVGVVTHEPLLYDGLTGAENLRFFARMFALDRIDERIHAVAAQMGVVERLDARIGTLSHGMRRRFSIARALLHSPRLLIMDEPESGLDQQALGLLEALVTDRSNPTRTILMTTHNLERGIALADRVAILSRGRIAYEGTPDAGATKAAYRKQTEGQAEQPVPEQNEDDCIVHDGAKDATVPTAAYSKQAQFHAKEHNVETCEKALDR